MTVVCSMIRFSPRPDQAPLTLEILRAVRGPTLAQEDCVDCQIWHTDDQDPDILFLELWESEAALHAHLRSDRFLRVLAALELPGGRPEVDFYHVSAREGMELIHRLRDGPAAEETGAIGRANRLP